MRIMKEWKLLEKEHLEKYIYVMIKRKKDWLRLKEEMILLKENIM